MVEQAPGEFLYKVLFLPGLLCTDLIFSEMLADPALDEAAIMRAAGNPPGFKGQAVPSGFDYSIEAYAEMVEALAAEQGYDLLVGHSFFGNVLIEVAARQNYRGKLMLISPSLSRMAEGSDTRSLDSMSRKPVLSNMMWWLSYLMLKSLFKPYFTEEKQDLLAAVVADARKTPRAGARMLLLSLFNHLDKYEHLTRRLRTTKVPVLYVRGQEDNIGFSDEDRLVLEANPLIRIRDIPQSRHFAMMDKPHEVNALIIEMLKKG